MVIGHGGRPHRHKGFYIFLMTAVVGIILILLLINDEGEFILTGSSIGIEGEEDEAEKVLGKSEIGLKLSFDTVPEVREKIKLESVELVFEDLSSKINVNEEELELKNLDVVNMDIDGFDGEIDFNEISISLKGKAEKVMVNGIEISSKGKTMKISFNSLVYESLKLSEMELSSIEFGEGKGELLVEERMNYNLENEEVEVNGFEGDLSVGLDEESLVVLEGTVSGFLTEGEFDLSVG